MSETQNLERLLILVKRHALYVFPIAAGDKDPPLIRDNLTQASKSESRIRQWAKLYPGCNWGIACKLSNLIVVDVDTKPGKSGGETFDDLDLEYGWPATFTVQTPSGGKHLYYRIAPGHQHIMRVSGFGKDVDSTNYVVAPFSVLTKRKPGNVPGTYTIIEDTEIAPTPAWFWDVLGRKAATPNVEQEFVVEPDLVDQI